MNVSSRFLTQRCEVSRMAQIQLYFLKKKYFTSCLLRLSDPEEPLTPETLSLAAKVLWHCWSSTRHEDSWEKLKCAVITIEADSGDESLQTAKENVERCLDQYRVWHPVEVVKGVP